MKNKLTKKTKIIIGVIALIIVVGIIITLTAGLNFDLRYEESKRVEFYLETDFKQHQ